jgi:hypothetical protein
MTASHGSPTTYLTYSSSVYQIGGPVVQTSGSRYGGATGFTLFSVYRNDVALAAGDSLIHLYADDNIMYTSGPSLDTVLTSR